MHKWIPILFFKQNNIITNWFFGITSLDEKTLLKQILKDTNPKFLTWAIDKIVSWSNQNAPTNLIQIHGNKDRIFPITFINTEKIINHGGHFMILNKSFEINNPLHEILNN